MKNRTIYILPIILFVLVMFIPFLELHAAPGCVDFVACCNGSMSGKALCGGCPECPEVPIDGGISALLVAGVAYGAKRVYGKSKS